MEAGDDAAAYRLPDGRALVATVDFFTPIVDDPYEWGRIGAANALSDVYAMGARPAIALNLVSWPVEELPLELLGKVLQGGIDMAGEAGVVVVGGHTITDPEPKYGMVALGFAEEDLLVRNSTAPAGASLLLTKPLGLGIISTAIKRGDAGPDQIVAAIDTMTGLNAAASEAMVEAGAQAATDVTGFGFLGHLQRMLEASTVGAVIDAAAVALLPGVLDLARIGAVPGGTRRNHAYLRGRVEWGELTEPEQLILADAQTSGGLLIAATDDVRLAEALDARGVAWAEVGVTTAADPGHVTVAGRLREFPSG